MILREQNRHMSVCTKRIAGERRQSSRVAPQESELILSQQLWDRIFIFIRGGRYYETDEAMVQTEISTYSSLDFAVMNRKRKEK